MSEQAENLPPDGPAGNRAKDDGSRARRIAKTLEGLAKELHPERARRIRVERGSDLERDLGIDSLARAELLLRLERDFGVRLSDDAVMTAETVADLLSALDKAEPGAFDAARWETTPAPESATSADQARTLVDSLAFHKEEHPDRTHIRLIDAEGDVETISYRELWTCAQEIAANLGESGLRRGSTVGIMLPTCKAFFHVFFGSLIAGCVPVPIYPPFRRTQIEEHLRRQARILENAEVEVLVTTSEAALFGRLIKAQVTSIREVLTADALKRTGAPETVPQADEHDLALLQYTSGSTGDPKGVMLTHANLLANIRAIGDALEVTSQDVVVSWLPLYHDMGLIGTWLGSLHFACPFVVMSPITVLARPERWLWAIHRFGGTLSAAPNFAYELVLTRVPDENLEGLDLSSWRMASNGAERISARTIERFTKRFAPYGFRAEAMTPMYGLAESAVALTTTPIGRGPRVDRVRRDDLVRLGRAEPLDESELEDSYETMAITSCGVPISSHEVRIVDDAGRELGDRQQGEIQFRGPSATEGYLHNPEKTAEVKHDGWLSTGDTGYMASGELYITGRIKDIIIRAGRNLYPDEIEDAIGTLEGIRKGRVAVFASDDPDSGTERLIVLAETRETREPERDRLEKEIAELVRDITETGPDDIVLAPPGAILKTPNGKVRRAACRDLYESGRTGRPPPALWQQIAGLLQASVRPELRRWEQAFAALTYAVRFQMVYRGLSPLVFLGILLLPKVGQRRRLFGAADRVMLRLAGVPVEAEGLERLPVNVPVLMIANHGSYLDGLVLSAVLPRSFTFVAKGELKDSAIAGTFLRRLGTVFVERFDPAGGVETARGMVEALKSGENLLVFPEGTFDRRPGLRAFHMGAFLTACQSGVPIVPLGLSGTRTILRGDSAFARRGRVRLGIGDPIWPEGEDWQAAIELRDKARRVMLALCGEPELIGEPTAI